MDLIVSLPIADRDASRAFYAALLEAEPSADEPLSFALGDAVTLMLIPRGGFGWVVGAETVAEPGIRSCLLSLPTADVDAVFARAVAAGAATVGAPEQKPWGYTATFADPDGHLWSVDAGA